jgi:hypothetical protein
MQSRPILVSNQLFRCRQPPSTYVELSGEGGPKLGTQVAEAAKGAIQSSGGRVTKRNRVAAAVGRRIVRLVPPKRREWVEALWAEAQEVTPGLRRLIWRAGGLRLAAGAVLLRRRILAGIGFVGASAFVVWKVWPGPPDSVSTALDRIDALGIVVVLVALLLVSRRFLGAVGEGRTARFLRVGVCIGLLALVLAKAVVERLRYEAPPGDVSKLLRQAIDGRQNQMGIPWLFEVLFFLVPIALYAGAFFWLTSRRSRVAADTVVIGTATGLGLGAVMYAIAPLGLSGVATNPWLPGSYIDPLVVIGWILVLFGSVAASVIAFRRFTESDDPPAEADQIRQVVAAGLLVNLIGALFVTVLGTVTIALMINASWFRNWLYNGHRTLFGIAGLQPVLRGKSGAIAYGHQITAASDWNGLLLVCFTFPVVAVIEIATVVMFVKANARVSAAGPRRGDGGSEPDPGPVPGLPGGDEQLAVSANHETVPVLPVVDLRDSPNAGSDRVLISVNGPR